MEVAQTPSTPGGLPLLCTFTKNPGHSLMSQDHSFLDNKRRPLQLKASHVPSTAAACVHGFCIIQEGRGFSKKMH